MLVLKIKSDKNEEMIDIANLIQREVTSQSFNDGLVVAYCPHTTAGLTINEGMDPAVKADMLLGLGKMVPQDKNYAHAEGNSPAHIKASLIGASVTLLVENGSLVLGQWQRIFFCEFDGPRQRTVWLKFI